MNAPLVSMLPARTDVAGFARAAVDDAASAAALIAGWTPAHTSDAAIAGAYTSAAHLRIDGTRPLAFDPLSAFFAARDGIVRTHANYPWHRAALLTALGLDRVAGSEAVADAVAARSTAVVVETVAAHGGIAVPVRPASWEALGALSRTPLVTTRPTGPGGTVLTSDGSAPLRGVRVLDLTRVIAGPVATRTLALFGADVLRIDPPQHPELTWQHLDAGHGKRSALLDVAAPRFGELLEDADVLVTGYRPGALERRGVDAAAWLRDGGGRVWARLSAWGPDGGRGFDSVVQAASGISMVESSGDGIPGALPAQALDHSAGYRLAAAVMRALARRSENGAVVETSLLRMAAELLSSDTRAEPARRELIVPVTQTFDVAGVEVETVAPAVGYVGGPTQFAPPRPWGGDDPVWLPRER